MAVSIDMAMESETILSIGSDADVVLARARGGKLARNIGMGKVQVADVAIAISELASNIVKHRVIEGKIIIREIGDEGRKGIEVISSDRGPGIADIDQAMTDGYSTAGSLGIGLSAVNRLMDEFEVKSNEIEGTLITTRKWVKPELPYISVPDLDLSVFSRPLPGQRYNGDAYFVKRYEDKVILAIIDGLGHGQAAQEVDRFHLELSGLGAFPNLQRPRVAWVGLEGQVDSLTGLQKLVDSGLARLGFTREPRSFTPHLTLARLREGISAQERYGFGEILRTTPFKGVNGMDEDSISLMKSTLTSSGALYDRLALVKLR